MTQQWIKEGGKSKVRCLALWGGKSFADEKVAMQMCDEYYESASFELVEGAGHWIAEEKPAEFVQKVLSWVGKR